MEYCVRAMLGLAAFLVLKPLKKKWKEAVSPTKAK